MKTVSASARPIITRCRGNRATDPAILSGVDLTVREGEFVAVIGPNGAGKTSLIDAVSGFAASQGKVLLDDADMSKQPAMRRARAGVARSFQSLELFEDSTVFENLSVAADPQDLRSYFLDLLWPINPKLRPEVVRAITEFAAFRMFCVDR